MIERLARVVTLTLFAGTATLAVPTVAQAQTTPPANGRLCSAKTVTDVTLEGYAQTGYIEGGLLVADAPGATIKMTCTIQVGAANGAHNGTDSCVAASAPTLQSTAIPPTFCTYDSPDGFPVYMCSQVTINGIDWFWDSNPPGTGAWTQSSSAFCSEALVVEILPGHLCTVTLILYAALNNGPLDEEAPGDFTDGDFLSIGGGAVLIGPDGDMYTAGTWFPDCRPFDNPPTDPDRVIFPDQHICPLGPDGTYGPIIIYQGDMYIDANANGMPDPDELYLDCPPHGPLARRSNHEPPSSVWTVCAGDPRGLYCV